MTETDRRIEDFLAGRNWQNARRFPLASDASERRYVRLQGKSGATRLLVRSGEAATMRATSVMTDLLLGWGFSAPTIEAWEPTAGLMLIEDFGPRSYRQALARGEDESALYRLAIDTLIALAEKFTPPLPIPEYRADGFLEEQEIFLDWHCPAWNIPISPKQRRHYHRIWEELLDHACRVPRTLILRDFHVDNLFYLPERPGVRACGLIDFQDARVGPCTYDPISLMHDVRHSIAEPAALYRYFYRRLIDARPDVSSTLLRQSCAILSCHRLCKIAGIFVRLERRDGKSGYRQWLPRTWELLQQRLEEEPMARLRRWFADNVPPRCRAAPPAP